MFFDLPVAKEEVTIVSTKKLQGIKAFMIICCHSNYGLI
jgi:hypothetical protein